MHVANENVFKSQTKNAIVLNKIISFINTPPEFG